MERPRRLVGPFSFGRQMLRTLNALRNGGNEPF